MAIYLVQHGKSLPKEQDPKKGLSPEGIAEVQRIANVAADYGVQVARIIHSGKQRALQTAEIMAEALSPTSGIQATQGIDPLDDVTTFAPSLEVTSDAMIVGHLPFLERLAAYLITGQDRTPVFQMQNGGIVCLDYYRDTKQMVVKWALMPAIR